MYHHEFKLGINTDELNNELFKETSEYLKEQTEDMQKKLFDKVSSDIEEFMYERFDNVQQQYFENVVTFLLNREYRGAKDKEKLTKWLSSLGHDQQSFRKKIFEDNKEEITKQISYDASYELVENMFKDSYFKSWDFGDISTAYPQTQVVKGFLNALVKKDGFEDYLKEKVSHEMSNKLEDFNKLSKIVEDLEEKVDKLYSDY